MSGIAGSCCKNLQPGANGRRHGDTSFAERRRQDAHLAWVTTGVSLREPQYLLLDQYFGCHGRTLFYRSQEPVPRPER
jgi:hypothetical protein